MKNSHIHTLLQGILLLIGAGTVFVATNLLCVVEEPVATDIPSRFIIPESPEQKALPLMPAGRDSGDLQQVLKPKIDQQLSSVMPMNNLLPNPVSSVLSDQNNSNQEQQNDFAVDASQAKPTKLVVPDPQLQSEQNMQSQEPEQAPNFLNKTRIIGPNEPQIKASSTIKGRASNNKIRLADDQDTSEMAQDQSIEEEESDESVLKNIELRTQQVREQKRNVAVEPPDDSDERVEFQFENTDLLNLINQVSELFNVTFITDDIIDQLPQGSQTQLGKTSGAKISFRTHKAMTKKQAWTLFLSFLDIAGFAAVPQPTPRWYRIVALPKGQAGPKFPVPSYIGVDPQTLPDNDQLIRFVYFVENGNYDVIFNVVDKLRSTSSEVVGLGEAKAFILTDKSYNIKMLMVIVKELDRVSLPQAMSVLKLRSADATTVAELFKALTGKGETQQPLFMPQRKEASALYFPENTTVIPEPRTNALILLGTPEAIEKIEDFVRRHIDKDPDVPHSPLFHFDLKYADALTVVKILDATAKEFGSGTEAGKVGGLRGVDKYFKAVSFIADPNTNRVIMRGDYQDYLMIKELVESLDEPQPQVAIEVLLLEVDQAKSKFLGAQVRSKNGGICGVGPFNGHNVQFQTSGLTPAGQGIVERTVPTTETDPQPVSVPCRLMGQLLDLVKGLPAGNTILTLGADCMGVWGIFRILESFTALEILANPFTVTSNKQRAVINIGNIRRVVSSSVISETNTTEGFENMEDGILVEVVPLINSDGMISLEIKVSLQRFTEGSVADQTAKTTREVVTKAIVADREVLAIGGLIQNRMNSNQSKVPVLGDLPLIGWLFKNKSKDNQQNNLLILISTQIIDPRNPSSSARFTEHHINDYYGSLDSMSDMNQNRDPIHNIFFAESPDSVERKVETSIFNKPAKRTKKMRALSKQMDNQAPEKQSEQSSQMSELEPKIRAIKSSEQVSQKTGAVQRFPIAVNDKKKRRIKVSLTADSSDKQEAVA